MSVPKVINDGNWSTLTPMSGDAIEFPFSDKGDNVSFRAVIPYRQDKDSYKPRTPMTVLNHRLGQAYLTKLGDPRDIGNNIYEFEDTFSSVPVTRTEYGSFPYTQQWWRGVVPDDQPPGKYFYEVNFDVEEQTFTVAAEFVYEYFKDKPPDPLIKPRVFLLFGVLMSLGGTPIIDNRLVAEDSRVCIYEGKIYERMTPYVRIRVPQPVAE